MKVYVLLAWWDNPSDEGREVIGVYAHRDDAQKAMMADIDSVKADYGPDWEWDAEYSEESDNYVYLASGICTSIYATICCWEIEEREVK